MSSSTVASTRATSASHLNSALPPPMDPRHIPFDRLSLPPSTRLTASVLASSLSGFFLGAAKGMSDSELRFRAENAHRLPTTTTGWYLYHKSKNYNALLGGIKEGAKMGARLSVWGVVFLAVEEGVDRGRARVVRTWRRTVGAPRRRADGDRNVDAVRLEKVAGNRDFMSTAFAGLATGGVYAAWSRMPLPTAVRLMKMGLKFGLIWGLVQDVVNVGFRGRRLGYVEVVKGLAGGSRSEVRIGEREGAKGASAG